MVSFPEISGKVWGDSSFCYLNSLCDLEIFNYIQIDFLASITGPEPWEMFNREVLSEQINLVTA